MFFRFPSNCGASSSQREKSPKDRRLRNREFGRGEDLRLRSIRMAVSISNERDTAARGKHREADTADNHGCYPVLRRGQG
jgi:hypothetical protein